MKFFFQHIVCCLIIIACITSPNQAIAQAPDWSFTHNDFQNVMSIILTISDECVPSDDPLDLVGAFDINGEIRGVQPTDGSNGLAFLSVYSNGGGEQIFFKVYDNSTDSVYSITNYSLDFQPNQNLGFPDPIELIFDSQSTAIGAAGPDQEVFNQTTTTLGASGSGSWTIIEGFGGSFEDDTDPLTAFTGVIGSTYRLVWIQDNPGACFGESDEVSIMFIQSGSCNQELIQSANAVITQSEAVADFIETNGIVQVGSIDFTAGNYVLMNPGFSIELGAEFHTYITMCN